MVQREPRATRRRVVVNQALQALGEVEGELIREEAAIAAERARLGEAWSLLHERVELCRRQDAAAQAERQEALRFTKETRDSVKREAQEVMDQLDADREAFEAETASRHEELAAAQQNFAVESEDTREIGRASCRERV